MAPLGAPVIIDGSYGEGGPALVRTALVMSAMTQQPLRIEFVRGKTPNPGLKPEDLMIIRALAVYTDAELVGVEVNSSTFSFLPTRPPKGVQLDLDVPEAAEGAGSANALVVMNALIPVLARTGVYTQLTVNGETHGAHVLSYDYFSHVTVAALRKLGLYSYPNLDMAGYGRLGRGQASIEVEPSVIQPVRWAKRGNLVQCRAVLTLSDVPESIGQRGIAHLARLGFFSKLTIDSEVARVKSRTPGVFVTIWAEFENGIGGSTAMGARGIRIESVAQSAFDSFFQWYSTESTVDPYLADQILLTAIRAEGESTFMTPLITQRLLTKIWVIKQFLPIHITIRGQENEPGVIVINP
jgi:RNA 3'-terminal phosphate cyclase (ATP)